MNSIFHQLLVNTFISGSIYTLIAIGFSLIYSTTKFFHFAHGAIYTLSPYCAYLLISKFSLPVLIAIPLAILSATFVGLLIEYFIYRPLRGKGSSLLVLLLSSMGIYIVLQNVISLAFGDDTRTLRTEVVDVGMKFLGARITPIQVAIIVTCFIFLLSCWALMKYTNIGTAMRAVAANPELAFVTGIDTDKVILFAFAIGSALAGVAGILI
jgi:branched-chain amino acid transport system permease protein